MDLFVHLGSYRCLLRSDIAFLISVIVMERKQYIIHDVFTTACIVCTYQYLGNIFSFIYPSLQVLFCEIKVGKFDTVELHSLIFCSVIISQL